IPGPTSGSTGPLKVSFTPGPDYGSPITSYRVACTSSNGGAPGSRNGTASPITVTGLTTAKTYACTVTATNARGTGVASSPRRGTRDPRRSDRRRPSQRHLPGIVFGQHGKRPRESRAPLLDQEDTDLHALVVDELLHRTVRQCRSDRDLVAI